MTEFDHAPVAAPDAAARVADSAPVSDLGPAQSSGLPTHAAWRLRGGASALTPSAVLALQRGVGNAAVARTLADAGGARPPANRALGAPGLSAGAPGGGPSQRNRRVLQCQLAGEIAALTLEGFRKQLDARGVKLGFVQARKLYEEVVDGPTVFKTIDQVIAEFGLSPSAKSEPSPSRDDAASAPSGPSRSRDNAASTMSEPSPGRQNAASATSGRNPSEDASAGRVPVETVSQIAAASEEAQAEAVSESSKVEQRAAKPKSETDAKQHTPVSAGGARIIVNNVWLGSDPLGPLEKFNLYSWRALGHTVNIYTYPFAGDPPRTAAALGLENGDATVIHLGTLLGGDNAAAAGTAKAALGDARSILLSWLAQIPAQGKPTQEHIYNMVDLTKSYLGGTQRGIVLDMKVGPSVHLQDYEDSFNRKLISYTRGRNTAGGLPENQSMGTMQESDELRKEYAERFNAKVKSLAGQSPNKAWFDALTGAHGRSYEQTRKWLDVATKTPSGGEADDAKRAKLKDKATPTYEVGEPGGTSWGPFRVLKAAGDQTNKGGPKSNPNTVPNLAEDVWSRELSGSDGDATFIRKAQAAMQAMPRT